MLLAWVSRLGKYWWAQQLCYQKLHNFHSNGSRITFSFWQGSHCVPCQTHCHTTSSCVMASLTWDIEERVRSTTEDQPSLFARPSDCPSRSEVRNSAVGPLQHPPVTLILSKHVMFPCQGNWKDHLKGVLHHSFLICNHHKNFSQLHMLPVIESGSLFALPFSRLQVTGSPQPTADVFLPLSNMLTRKCGSSPWSCLPWWNPKTWQQSSLVQYHPEAHQYNDSEIKVSVPIYFTCFQDEAIPHKSSVTSCSTAFSTSLEFNILCSWGQVWQRARLRGGTHKLLRAVSFWERHLRDMLGSQEVRDILTVVRKQHDLELKQSVSVSNSTITRCSFSSHLPTSGCC